MWWSLQAWGCDEGMRPWGCKKLKDVRILSFLYQLSWLKEKLVSGFQQPPSFTQQQNWNQSSDLMINLSPPLTYYTTFDTIDFQALLPPGIKPAAGKGTQSSPGPHRCVVRIRPVHAQDTPPTGWHLWDKKKMPGSRFPNQRLGSQILEPAWVQVLPPLLNSCKCIGFLRSASFSMLSCKMKLLTVPTSLD